jgi:hypothetical protein
MVIATIRDLKVDMLPGEADETDHRMIIGDDAATPEDPGAVVPDHLGEGHLDQKEVREVRLTERHQENDPTRWTLRGRRVRKRTGF